MIPSSRFHNVFTKTALLALAWLGSAAFAQERTQEQERPDFSGVWLAFASEPAFIRDAEASLSEEGREILETHFAQFGDNYVEPGSYCVPPGMPSTMTSIVGYPIEIIHSDQRLTMLAEMEMQVRRIYMDGRQHPDNYPRTGMGHSIGHWEGDTLVIDTALLNERLTQRFPRTEDTRVSERIHMTSMDQVDAQRSGFITTPPEGDDVLVFDITVKDPTLYNEPRNMKIYYQRIDDQAILEYACAEDLWQQAQAEALEQEEQD